MASCVKNTGVDREAVVAMPGVDLAPRVEPAQVPALVLSYYAREHCDDGVLFIATNLRAAGAVSRTTRTPLTLHHLTHRGEHEAGEVELGVVQAGPGEGCAVLRVHTQLLAQLWGGD